MKIILVDSEDVQESLAQPVRDFLVQFPGKWEFDVLNVPSPAFEYDEDEDFDTSKTQQIHYMAESNYESSIPRVESWKTIFKRLDKIRKANKLGKDDFILLYTAERNEFNWFGMFDIISQKPQGFVQSSYWNEYVNSEAIFPILYETIAVPLHWRMFKNAEELAEVVHREPIGCINDFCEIKSQIMLKLQTGNICKECYDKALAAGVTEEELDHFDQILDAIRLKFREFNQRRKKRDPYPVRIENDGRKIFIGDSELKLRPLDKTLYLFFLHAKEEYRTNDLYDYERQLLEFYKPLYTGGDTEEMVRNAGKLARNEDGLTNQAVSRINKSIENLVIEELADRYKIKTNRDGYKKVEMKFN